MAQAIHTQAVRQPEQIAAVYLSLGMAPNTVIHDQVARRDSGAPMHRRRFEADNVQGIPALWADIDILGPGHAGTLYPPDERSALEVANSIGLPPSCVIHSGGGLQPYWLFTEPWLATDAADPVAEQTAMAELSRDLVNTLRHHANRLGGWTVDSVFNLDRVMRAPGSLNTKNDGAVPVRLLSLDAARRYEPDQIREHLAPDDVLEGFAARSMGAASAKAIAESLPGLDLAQAWRTTTAAPGNTPAWLSMLLEADPGSTLEDTWTGDRPEYGGDQNRFDAALVRLLVDAGASVQRQAEAVMARRLRAGVNVEKVDPRVRTDYLLRTLITIHESAAEARAVTGRRTAQLEVAARAAVTASLPTVAPPPVPVPTEPDSPVTPEPDAEQGASARSDSAATAEPTPEPPPEEEFDPANDDLSAEVAGIIAAQEAPPADMPPRRLAVVEQRVRADRSDAEAARETPMPDPWGQRSEGLVAVMSTLDEVLLPEPYRDRGVRVWRLEQRDRGPVAMGRMVLALPEDFDWPDGHRPDLYRPGRPLYTAWRKRQEFETPAGYRRSLEHDGKIPALPVAVNQADWPIIISSLVPWWKPDSSGTDMTTQVHEWLYDYLTGRAPTSDESEALAHGQPYLADHADWGARGAPQIMVLAKSFLDYISMQPGGPANREGKLLLDHLHVTERRPRIQRDDGTMTRKLWLEIASVEFRISEWREILTVAEQAQDARRLRVLRQGDAG